MNRLDETGDYWVILQVEPDAGEFAHGGDPVRGELVEGADAGEQQQLRRVDGAAREDHLARAPGNLLVCSVAVGDTDGARAVDQHARDLGAGGDGQVWAPERGTQVGVGG